MLEYGCDFEKNTSICKNKKAKCQDYKGKLRIICEEISKINYKNEDSTIKCVFKDGKCIEEDFVCESHKEKDKNSCESIIP